MSGQAKCPASAARARAVARCGLAPDRRGLVHLRRRNCRRTRFSPVVVRGGRLFSLCVGDGRRPERKSRRFLSWSAPLLTAQQPVELAAFSADALKPITSRRSATTVPEPTNSALERVVGTVCEESLTCHSAMALRIAVRSHPPRRKMSLTCTADHWPPRAVGTPRAVSSRAMARRLRPCS